MCRAYRVRKQKTIPWKTCVFQQLHYEFGPNSQSLYASVHKAYSKKFTKAIDTVQQIQQFKLERLIFQVNVQLEAGVHKILSQLYTAFH